MILAPLLVWLFLIVAFALAFIVRRAEGPDMPQRRAPRHHEQS
jgi:hypothetical protein